MHSGKSKIRIIKSWNNISQGEITYREPTKRTWHLYDNRRITKLQGEKKLINEWCIIIHYLEKILEQYIKLMYS